jgi:hypothetical protein
LHHCWIAPMGLLEERVGDKQNARAAIVAPAPSCSSVN